MAVRYYVDTAIWRDLHENRVDRFRPLGEWAFEFFRVARINKDKILFSDPVLEELSKVCSDEDIKELFGIVQDSLEKVETKESDAIEARKLSVTLNIHFGDALHIILARKHNAIIVTRDRHFDRAIDIVTIKKPEDLI